MPAQVWPSRDFLKWREPNVKAKEVLEGNHGNAEKCLRIRQKIVKPM